MYENCRFTRQTPSTHGSYLHWLLFERRFHHCWNFPIKQSAFAYTLRTYTPQFCGLHYNWPNAYLNPLLMWCAVSIADIDRKSTIAKRRAQQQLKRWSHRSAALFSTRATESGSLRKGDEVGGAWLSGCRVLCILGGGELWSEYRVVISASVCCKKIR